MENSTAPETTTTETKLDLKTVQDFLNSNDEGKAFLNSYTDSKVTKAIDSWKNKTLPSVVEAEISKRFPGETEEQKAFRALKNEFEQTKREAQREKLINKATQYASEKSIPTKFLDRFIGESEEDTIANIEAFGTYFKEAVQQAVSGEFKTNGRTVTADSDKKGTITVADMSTMTRAELLKHQNSIKF